MSTSLPLLSRAQVSRIRELSRDKHARQTDGTFVVEGAKAVRDLLSQHPNLVRAVVATPAYLEREPASDRALREAIQASSYSCKEHAFGRLSDLETPQGILAVAVQSPWNEERVLSQPVLFGIWGEAIRDPLNVGSMIRTAAALGVSALWLSPDSADPYSSKAVRASAGALFTLPVFTNSNIGTLTDRGCAFYAAVSHGGHGTVPMCDIERVPQRMILAVGNEGQGLSTQTIRQATSRFTIPLSRHVESLNVAATVAIAAFYFGRLPRD
ncbi:MAG TPA: RNA methyltransferase [Nitrospira sp.]|nr:RNA methyltransferase [Nitrospira sp.]